jgi:hypothetical protein
MIFSLFFSKKCLESSLVKQQGKTKFGILLPAIKRDLQLSLSLSWLFDINAVKRGRGRENMNNIQYSKAKVVLKWLAV